MRILHITSWYVHKEKPFEAIWTKRLIDSLADHCQQEVWHIAVSPGKHLQVICRQDDDNVKHILWRLPTKFWVVAEVVNFFLLLYYFGIKRIHRNCDVINFHIAYPQLTFWSVLRYFIKKPVVVFEHWSAYHFNFGVERQLPRIQKIFTYGLPLITVSESLLTDIKIFSKQSVLKSLVVPNVINTKIFYPHEECESSHQTFFMLSQWKWPKRPDVVIRAFDKLIKLEEYSSYQLRIGGDGDQIEEMKELIDSLGISKNVVFLGSLASLAIAIEMNNCRAFLHCSEYETFSVVCAEALSCGRPVIASEVGGIPELINAHNGVLIESNTVEDWFSVLKEFNHLNFDSVKISSSAKQKFSEEEVGLRYFNVLKEICVTYK